MIFERRPPVFNRETLVELQNTRGIPSDTWYIIAAATLCGLNRPDDLVLVFKHAIEGVEDSQEQMRVARRIREVLIKSAGICGLPRASTQFSCEPYVMPFQFLIVELSITIDALLILKGHTPRNLLDDATHPTPRGKDFVETTAEEAFARGKKFFDVVYTGISEQTMNILNWCGTPDLGAIARIGYAFFLSHTDILTAGESMMVTVSGSIAMDVQRVARSHMAGAVNHGVTVVQITAVRDMAMGICQRVWSYGGHGGWAADVAKL